MNTVPASLRLGTRGSPLALVQSRWVAGRITERTGVPVELVTIRTSGDVLQDRPLAEIGGKGLFTRELDVALLEGEIDLAVHSLKDLPTTFPEGLTLGAVPEREDCRDVLVGPTGVPLTLATLPEGARIGSSSLRRVALARAHRRDLIVENVRGNVETRMRRVDEGLFEAVVLAAAGVRRLGLADRVSEYLDPGSWLPAPGQGALGIVIREGEGATAPWLAALEHPATRAEVTAERALLHTLEAGCRLPVAALGQSYPGGVRLRGVVAAPDGLRVVRAEGTGTPEAAEALGIRVAEALRARGADLLLRELIEERREDPRAPAFDAPRGGTPGGQVGV